MPPHKIRQTWPNILVFLYDSLIGPMLSSFGGKAPTPAFDFFANGGVRFAKTAAHSLRNDVAVGAILTGRYPHSSGIHKLVLPEKAASMRQGYLLDVGQNLITIAYEESYRVRTYNCADILCFIPRAAWHNSEINPPHVAQLMHFINESKPGPFLIIDRFKSTAFPWRPDLPYDRRETDEEHIHMALAAMKSDYAKSLIERRMHDAAVREDARLMRIINLLHRHSLLENTIVALAGIPGDLSEEEMAALSALSGFGESSAPMFPSIVWYPKALKPQYIEDSIIRHVDIMPTLFELAGLKPPEGIDGKNLLPAIEGNEPFPEQTLTFYDGRVAMSASGEKSEINLDPAESTERAPDKKQRSLQVYRALGSPSVLPRRNDALLGEFVIPKRSVFIVGMPRSGTQFFVKFFQSNNFSNVVCKGHHWPWAAMFWDTQNLYSAGLVSKEGIKKRVFDAMAHIMESPEEIFACVSHDCMNLVSILAEVFPNAKFILLTRDPRKTIVSESSAPWMCQKVLRHSQVTPIHSQVTPIISKKVFGYWKAPFGIPQWIKFRCNIWNAFMKEYHKSFTDLGGRGIVVRFEDIFAPGKGFPGVKRIAEFLKEELRIPTGDEWLSSVFTEKVGPFAFSYPKWKDWDEKDKAALAEICGETMKMLGYDVNSNPE